MSILRKLANGACKYAEQLGLHAENEMMPILGMMAKITRHTAVLKRCHLFDVHIAAGGSFFWRTQPTYACYRFAHSMSRLCHQNNKLTMKNKQAAINFNHVVSMEQNTALTTLHNCYAVRIYRTPGIQIPCR